MTKTETVKRLSGDDTVFGDFQLIIVIETNSAGLGAGSFLVLSIENSTEMIVCSQKTFSTPCTSLSLSLVYDGNFDL